MKAILQRVSEARVRIDGDIVGEIGAGLMILYCAEAGDGDDAVQRLAEKTAKLRIFADDAGKMNKAITDIGGSALVVSQFTLAADTRVTPDRSESIDPVVDWPAVIRLGLTMSTTAGAAAAVTHSSLDASGRGALVLAVMAVGFTGSLLRTVRR